MGRAYTTGAYVVQIMQLGVFLVAMLAIIPTACGVQDKCVVRCDRYPHATN